MIDNAQLMQTVQNLAHDLLTWVGFGTLSGLLAKALMPGRDPGGTVATLLMGIGGSVIGSGILMVCTDGMRVTPISPLGFVVATSGAFILLASYRVMGGYWFRESTPLPPVAQTYTRRVVRRSRRGDVVYEDA
jgi:uncharacterized membrane protein YeaQ/YmgE (transglycosylase-associated protein family)